MAQQPFPYTLANLPAGNNPVSDIDANFAVVVRGPSSTTSGQVPVWDNASGTSISIGLATLPAAGTITKLVGIDGSNALPAVSAVNLTNIPVGTIRTYISGLTLSNDGGTPNTILDVAAGTCADSTNATMITLAAFTKTTGGAWTAGTGNAGMGTGLTIANSTWYHVFAIINNALADVYFDTSASAANAPAGTTSFRRIGSFKTDGSAHIITFIQFGNNFRWVTPVLDGSNVSLTASFADITLTTPLGVQTQAYGSAQSSSGTETLFLRPKAASGGSTPSLADIGGSNSTVYGYWSIVTDTASKIQWAAAGSVAGNYLLTEGWYDLRGTNL